MKKYFILITTLLFFIGLNAQTVDKTKEIKQAEPKTEANKTTQPQKAKTNVVKTVPVKQETVAPKDDETENQISDLQDRLDDLEDRLDGVETATMVDRIKLSADVRFTMNNFIYDDNTKGSEKLKDMGAISSSGENFNTWNMRARIKMLSWLNKSIKFTGWLTMYKNFLDSYPDMFEHGNISPSYDGSRGYLPSDSRIYMERLFVDWFITDWMAFSIGRGPTYDGSPSDLRYDTVPLSSFPENIVNLPLDGFYFTLITSHFFPSLKNSFFRLGYIPRRYTIQNKLFETDEYSNMQNVFIASFDTSIPHFSNTKFYTHLTWIPNVSPYNPVGDFDGDGKNDQFFVSDTFGSWFIVTADIISKNFLDSPIDWFAGISYSQADPKARTKDDPNNGFIGTPIDKNGNTTPILTFLGDDFSGDSKIATMFYLGLRYTTPIKMFHNNVKIGVSYNQASKYFYMYYAPDTTYLSNFAVRGKNLEGYLIVPINRKAHIRFGYIYQHHDYPWGAAFAPSKDGIPKIDETIQNFNMMFNFYF